MTPAEVVEAALREHMRVRPQDRAVDTLRSGEPIRLSGREAEDAARIAVDALAAAGFSLVLTGDLRAYLYRKGDLKTQVEAMNRLLATAGPERSEDV